MDVDDLHELVDRYVDLAEEVEGARGDWPAVWDLEKEVRSAFGQTQFRTAYERHEFWQRFIAAVDGLRSLRSAVEQESAEIRDRLLEHAESAVPSNWLQNLFDGFIDGMIGLSEGEYLANLKNDLQEGSSRLASARESARDAHDDLIPRDGKAVRDRLKAAKGDLDAAWERYRDRRRDWVHGIIQEKIDKLEGVLERKREQLDHKEAHVEELEAKRADASSEEYADRVSGWIEEEEERMSSLRGAIDDIEEKLCKLRSDLEDT